MHCYKYYYCTYLKSLYWNYAFEKSMYCILSLLVPYSNNYIYYKTTNFQVTNYGTIHSYCSLCCSHLSLICFADLPRALPRWLDQARAHAMSFWSWVIPIACWCVGKRPTWIWMTAASWHDCRLCKCMQAGTTADFVSADCDSGVRLCAWRIDIIGFRINTI